MSHRLVSEKLERAAPFNVFYNSIPEISQEDNSIVFADLLCPSLGKLKCSLQVNSSVNIDWLMQQYEARNLGSTPITILYDRYDSNIEQKIINNFPNVIYNCLELKQVTPCKFGIYVYEDDSLRFVLTTASLYAESWDKYHQCIWVSPLCPRLSINSNHSGESPTGFKSSLIKFLEHYQMRILDVWLDYITKADFSEINVFLITTVPGLHPRIFSGSHNQQVREILKNHCNLPSGEAELWPIIAQTPCIGQYSGSENGWLRTYFLGSVATHSGLNYGDLANIYLKIVYPSVKNVNETLFQDDEILAKMRYVPEIHERQKEWLQKYFYKWKADTLGKSQILPHCKTYCRISPCNTKMAWFLVTSANLARRAWGFKKIGLQGTSDVFTRNYELGIMFLPHFFFMEFFQVNETRGFPVPFDLPLIQYEDDEDPWTKEDTTHKIKIT